MLSRVDLCFQEVISVFKTDLIACVRDLKSCRTPRAWAIFDSLGEDSTDTYTHLKNALLQRLSPDTEEDRLAALELLLKRKLQEGRESIDEVACDLEKLLDKASPGLPVKV